MGTSINVKDNTITNESGQVSISNTITNQFSIQSLAKNYPVSIPYYKGLPDPVKKFSGREDEIKQIHEYLQSISVTVLSQTATISGLGGVGKTETAKAFAKFYRNEFKIILYIVAENKCTLSDTVCKFANDFHVDVEYVVRDENGETCKKSRPIRDVVEELYNRCVSYGNTLIILDNVDEQSDIIDYLPSESLGDNKPKMLITSRRRDWELYDYGTIQTISLGVFDLKTATEFIKKNLDSKLYNDNDIEELCILLQYLPLALKQSMGFILVQNRDLKFTGKRYTISNYIQEYKTRTSALLEHEVDKSMYIYTVASTWGITIKKLIEKHGEEGVHAVKILEFLSYLLPDNISAIDIFHVDKDELNRKAVNLLDEYSMIDCNIEEYDQSHLYEDDNNEDKFLEDDDNESEHYYIDDDYIYADDNDDADKFVKTVIKISIHRLVQEVTTLEVKKDNKEDDVIENLMILLNRKDHFDGLSRQMCAVWNVACNYPTIVENYYKELFSNPLLTLVSSNESNLKAIQILCEHEYKLGRLNLISYSLERSVSSNDITKFKFIFDFIKRNRIELDINKVLYYQLINSDTDYAIFLLENSNSINHKFWQGETPVMVACKKKNERLTRYLCDKKCDINIKSDTGNTAFMFACKSGSVNIIKILMSTGKVDVNEQNLEGWTGLMFACCIRSSEAADYLINTLKTELNFKNDQGVTALMLALKHGLLNTAMILINADKIELNLLDNNGMSALLYACKGGYLDIIKILLENKNVESKVQDYNGITAFMYGLQSKNMELIKYFISNCELDLKIRDNNGMSILMYACNYSDLETVKHLIEVIGAEPNVQSDDGASICMYACKSKCLNIVKYLIDIVKVDLGYVDSGGKSIFMYACIYGTLEIVKYLVETDGIEINARDRDGLSAVMYACMENDTDIVKYILDVFRLDLNERDEEGRSMLMNACRGLNYCVVKYLMDSGGYETNDTDKEGRTALHLTCLSKVSIPNRKIILKTLIRNGFDAYAKDVYNKTPIDYCNDLGLEPIAWFLVTNMTKYKSGQK